MIPLHRHPSLLIAALLALLATGCGRERLAYPEAAFGRTWFPAPSGRYGIEIIDDTRRGIQELWFRHRFREGRDGLIDQLQGPGSLVWSPNGKWVVINHRDYGFFHDFKIHRVTRHGLEERLGCLVNAQALWERLHPGQMNRLSFQGIRWSADGDRLLILAVGQEEEGDRESELIREAMWLDPTDCVVQIAEAPAEAWALRSPFPNH